jgi:uncharacterized protein YjbJ (UPF0337 family)
MAEESDVIRHQIEETRGSLAEKLETLEGQVKEAVGTVTDTIETVKHSVEHTVESVKSGVENTVDTVKDTFDLSRQVERHPWAAVGCSLLAGAAAGYLLGGPRRSRADYAEGIPGMDRIIPGYRPEPAPEPARQAFRPEPERPGFLSALADSFEGERGKIKQAAVGALMGIARDTLREALPESLAPNVTEIVDDITRRVGGEPVRGRVLQSGQEDDSARKAAAH